MHTIPQIPPDTWHATVATIPNDGWLNIGRVDHDHGGDWPLLPSCCTRLSDFRDSLIAFALPRGGYPTWGEWRAVGLAADTELQIQDHLDSAQVHDPLVKFCRAVIAALDEADSGWRTWTHPRNPKRPHHDVVRDLEEYAITTALLRTSQNVLARRAQHGSEVWNPAALIELLRSPEDAADAVAEYEAIMAEVAEQLTGADA